MPQEIIITVYKLEELSPAAQEKAITQLWDINVDFEWWDITYEDANTIGLIIDGFDIGRGEVVKGHFAASAEETAHKIEKEHGNTTPTFKTATNYLAERDKLIDNTPKDENGEIIDEYALDTELDELDDQFLKSLCEDYRMILLGEYEYFTSPEAVKETIISNEYVFTENGKLYK